MISRKNTLVTIVTNPQSGLPLVLRLIVTAPIQRGVATTSAARLIAQGGTGSFVYGLQVGSALPAGLTLDPVTGVIAGTPTAMIGRTAFVANVQDSSSTITLMRFTLDIVSRLTAVANAPLPGEIGLAYSYTFGVVGNTGTVSWTNPSGTLPPGLILSGATGVLSGTPSVPAGISTYVVRATDSGTGDTLDISVSQTIVAALSTITLYPKVVFNLPFTFDLRPGIVGGMPPYRGISFVSAGIPGIVFVARDGGLTIGGTITNPAFVGPLGSILGVTIQDALGAQHDIGMSVVCTASNRGVESQINGVPVLSPSTYITTINFQGALVQGVSAIGAVTTVDFGTAAVARGALGLGTAATQNTSAFDAAGAAAAAQAASQPLSANLNALSAANTAGYAHRFVLGQWSTVATIPVADIAGFNPIYQDFNVGTVGATKTIIFSTNGVFQHLLLTSATPCTLTFTAPSTACEVFLRVQAPAAGTIPAITWPATVKWTGAVQPAAVSTLGRSNMYRFVFDGANYWGDAIVNAA